MGSSSNQMSPEMKRWSSGVFVLIFLVVGAGVTFFGIRDVVRARTSRSWPSTQGTIELSRVVRHQSIDNKRNKTSYHAEIVYQFSVKGRTYKGDRITYGDHGSSRSTHAESVVKNYPEGKTVTVFYMSENPEECVVEPGIKIQSFYMPGFGLIFFIAGILMTVFLFKPDKPNTEN